MSAKGSISLLKEILGTGPNFRLQRLHLKSLIVTLYPSLKHLHYICIYGTHIYILVDIDIDSHILKLVFMS